MFVNPKILSMVLLFPILTTSFTLPNSVFETINKGGIAVVPDFLSPTFVSTLRNDAINLHEEGHFITDALATYGNAGKRDKDQFDPTKDRGVLPAYIPSKQQVGPFVSTTLGDASSRQRFTKTIAALRTEVARGLGRPGLDTPDGPNNHEISYTRFGPGAYLVRHNDEHHEELKGKRGWSTPTRRSISWLVYLNSGWTDEDGGNLRTYPRVTSSSYPVGSRNGDLQIGWLAPSASDRKERPVFLDGRRDGICGKCALYVDSDDGGRKVALTDDFMADPYLFLSSDYFVQNLLIKHHDLGRRFHYLDQPKSVLTKFLGSDPGETVKDVSPVGGTLVLFDSVTLPHEVQASLKRERWATSGWFHEAQQPLPNRQLSVV